MSSRDTILIIDFGGQYAHLIARRIRGLNVYSEIVAARDLSRDLVERIRPKGVILSGGPSSVLDPGSPLPPRWITELGIPVLGICYGHQALANEFGGKVSSGRGEFGRTFIRILYKDPIVEGLEDREEVWMSHSDYVEKPPENSDVIAVSEDTGYIAAFKLRDKPVYGVQFHPEVSHTKKGLKILDNFIRISGASRSWRAGDMVENIIRDISDRVGKDEKVLCAVSGGVDSTVTALLIRKAIGDRLVAVFVNHGFLREGEAEEVLRSLRDLGIEPRYIDASDRFLRALKGVSYPEEKRRFIGKIFAEIFIEIVREDPSIKWLAQGTTYPDVIESGSRPHSAKIKTHHNVGGL
ncbi:MAG: glutamine-hydrolyzing GMP synthase, partial [Sulfolobales archaeon]